MEFSRFGRFLTQGSGIVQLMEDLGDAAGLDDVCMLGGGNPGAIAPMQAFFREAMSRLVANGDRFDRMVGCYDSPAGDLDFRRALAKLLRNTLGWELDASNIAVTNGSQSTFFVLFNLFSGAFADDSTDTPTRRLAPPLPPEYIGYADTGLGADIFIANRPSIELLDDNLFKYHVDFERLDIDDGIGALCVSRPTNPTGNVLTDGE